MKYCELSVLLSPCAPPKIVDK